MLLNTTKKEKKKRTTTDIVDYKGELTDRSMSERRQDTQEDIEE